jgi:hypothetical protein
MKLDDSLASIEVSLRQAHTPDPEIEHILGEIRAHAVRARDGRIVFLAVLTEIALLAAGGIWSLAHQNPKVTELVFDAALLLALLVVWYWWRRKPVLGAPDVFTIRRVVERELAASGHASALTPVQWRSIAEGMAEASPNVLKWFVLLCAVLALFNAGVRWWLSAGG